MRRTVLAVAGLVTLAVLAVGLVTIVLVAPRPADTGAVSPVPPDRSPPIDTRVSLSPRTVFFGDTVTVRVDVTLDRTRVVAGSVRLVTDFEPWQQVAEPRRTRRDGETTTHLQTTWQLRCLVSTCLPPASGLQTRFAPATLSYRTNDPDAPAPDPIVAAWPTLAVSTRLDESAAAPSVGSGRSPYETPWRADLVSMPAPSYRVDPATARFPLFGLAALLALVGAGLAYAGRPRRRPQPLVVEAPPPPPPVSPLERALQLLEDGAAVNGATDRRRALELLAEALAGRDAELAGQARELAWSRGLPEVERTTPLAEQARPLLGLTHEEAAPEDPQPEAADDGAEEQARA